MRMGAVLRTDGHPDTAAKEQLRRKAPKDIDKSPARPAWPWVMHSGDGVGLSRGAQQAGDRLQDHRVGVQVGIAQR